MKNTLQRGFRHRFWRRFWKRFWRIFEWHFVIRRILYVARRRSKILHFRRLPCTYLTFLLYRAINKIVNVSCCECYEKTLKTKPLLEAILEQKPGPPAARPPGTGGVPGGRACHRAWARPSAHGYGAILRCVPAPERRAMGTLGHAFDTGGASRPAPVRTVSETCPNPSGTLFQHRRARTAS